MKKIAPLIVIALSVFFVFFRTPVHAATQMVGNGALLVREDEHEDEDESSEREIEAPERDDEAEEKEVFDEQETVPQTLQEESIPSAPAPADVPNETIVEQPAILPAATAESQATPAVAKPIVSQEFPWPWIVTRTTGVASFLLLTLLSITGMTMTTGLLFRLIPPNLSWSIHRAIASVLLTSVVIHVGALLFDHFINLHIVDLLIPFASHYRPVLVALGNLGFYLLLLVLFTSLYSMSAHPRFTRTVHFLAFPMFILIFLHAILLGTDSKQLWMIWIYWVCGGLVGMSVLYRLAWKYRPAHQKNAVSAPSLRGQS